MDKKEKGKSRIQCVSSVYVFGNLDRSPRLRCSLCQQFMRDFYDCPFGSEFHPVCEVKMCQKCATKVMKVGICRKCGHSAGLFGDGGPLTDDSGSSSDDGPRFFGSPDYVDSVSDGGHHSGGSDSSSAGGP
jgi:hypothetical protein